MKNNEAFIKERLSLINIILPGLGFDPEEKLKTLKREYKEMSTNIKDLIFIKENIVKFYKETYKDLIKDLIDNIKINEKMNIDQYKKGKIGELIRQCEEKRLKEKAEKIEKVKDFLLFNVIYEMNAGNNEETHFKDAYKKYENIGKLLSKKGDINKLYEGEENKAIINKIRDILCNNEEEAKNFIEKLKKLYIINDDNMIDEITILFNTKKYDLEIKSIIFFFEYFQKDEKWEKKLSKGYKNLSQESPQEIKKRLNELKKNENENEIEIYNYRGKNNYYTKLFTCLYNKKEAIDFIFEKIKQNINIDYLEEKIQPTNRTINIEDVIATERCVFHMNKMNDQDNNFDRLKYIKSLPPEEINHFEKYSQIYTYIIELDRIDDTSDNIYEQVIKIIKIDFSLKIDQDSEEFSYYLKDQSDPENITMEELIHLKNKIHGDSKKEDKNKDNKKGEKLENSKIKSKIQTLEFFKELIINLEIINKYMKVLRTKGSTLPIKIDIKVQMHKVEYYLGGKESTLKEIKTFLLNVKNKHISQLNAIYKKEVNIRFLYGKQFRSIIKHLEKTFHLDSFLRYILNITDNNKEIREGEKGIIKQAKDYITQYELYNQNSLDSISKYIRSLFENNNIRTIADHYNKMLINKGTYKGIYLHECENNTKEKYIIDLFWNKLTELPIAQNLLITSKETSSEEIQSFLHRAILCNYNTLFVVEINDSFSEYQQSIMNSYIDQLLTYKNQKHNEETKQNIPKKSVQSYLYPCIIFIYDKENKKINSFLKEIKKLEMQTFGDIQIDKETYSDKILTKLGKISVNTSEICGLGKSKRIRKIIKDNGKNIFIFLWEEF